MASSLQELLLEEGFETHKKHTKTHQKKVKFRDRRPQDGAIVLPIYVCHERRRSFDVPKKKIDNSKAFSQTGSIMSSSTRRDVSDSGRSLVQSVDDGFFFRRNEPAIDEVAVRAVVSILSGYIGQYLRDYKFRENTRAKCFACFAKNKDSDDDDDVALLEKMELGIENVERLVEDQELNVKSLQYCIKLFSRITAALNTNKNSKNGSISVTERSHLAACAQLYLSVVYKIHKNDRISARHLLQVFCDSPFIARTHLLPDIWEHLFLPHLLHIKIWYTEEAESSNSVYLDSKEMKMRALVKAYNEQMDIGTQKFALYYKEWLKDGATKAPAVPWVPLPSTLTQTHSRRRYSASITSHSSNKSSLYRAIFGPILHGDSNNHSSSEEQKLSTKEHNIDMETRSMGRERSSRVSHRKSKSELWVDDNKKSDYFRLLSCRNHTSESVVRMRRERGSLFAVPDELSRAITSLCSSDSLLECESAIRVIAEAWIDSQGDSIIKSALSNAQVIEAILEVVSVSSDDEILELAISILAQVVKMKEMNGNIILNFDPQLDIFLGLLRNNSLFLKAAVLLYLAKPKAKRMIAMEWIPLVLRVLEFGDQTQTLFTIQCSPKEAAFYLLHQLLNCFDEDKNMENAGYIVSLGGLNLLLRWLEIGDVSEMNKAAHIIYGCIRADGSCRHYLAQKLNKECLIALLVQRDSKTLPGQGLLLLTELFCLNRHDQRSAFLNELIKGWGGMNVMHILLVYLQRAKPEERPLVSAMLLQLDLLGDVNILGREFSVYREEAVEEIVKALDIQVVNEKVQEQCAKALLILGGQFTCTGEAVVEKWLLKQAGFDENSLVSFSINRTAFTNHTNLIREEEAAENWRRRTAMVLLKNGGRDLLVALSDSIANGIPSLARASLVTVCWISCCLQSFGEKGFLQSLACTVLVPQLLDSLNYEKTVEERVLASFALLKLLDGSDYQIRLSTMINGELIKELDKLSKVTWTAKELISILTTKVLMH